MLAPVHAQHAMQMQHFYVPYKVHVGHTNPSQQVLLSPSLVDPVQPLQMPPWQCELMPRP